jgi:signal transduction histidine kinase
VRRYLEIAMEELERAADIVTQLRDLSREPERKKEESVNLNSLIENTLLLTRKRCQNGRVEVEWNPAADLPAVPAVPDRVQQVFLNLVLNAVEAMPGGGKLRVSVSATDQPGGVRILFADTGVGIEPKRLPRIFEPFHSSRPEGLGLGLYLSKEIVEEHEGRIEVTSRAGEGTTFTVWLPR